ncbi:MAG TPA: hypothetical protein VFX98_14970, partial [Longimicrobiaceae bacterium]|nr:hypothetical protein [Longimicrobiaceae bacterium]
GEVIAVLRSAPEELEEQYSLKFYAGHDNLDSYEAAAIRLRSGRQLGLLRHSGSPDRGTEVHADPGDDAEAARAELLEALELGGDAFSWTSSA